MSFGPAMTLVAAIRTVAAAVAVSGYVLLVGPPVLLWTVISKRPRLLYAAAAMGVRMGFALAGVRVKTAGVEHMVQGAAVYVCNHTSNVDSPAVFYALRSRFPRVRVLYKAELRKLPVLVWAFDVAGFVPVERANKEQSWPAVDRAAAALCAGHSFFIFPEGTRSRTGELLPFKKGGFVMALKAQAPLVPVIVSGGRAAMRKGSPLIWPATVTVTFLPAVSTRGLSVEDRNQVIADVRARMTAAIGVTGTPDRGSASVDRV
ncbi:MAG: 1-acyl-sn-glycerol-3-phosphate acyltransferase [Acidobacteria bacterium]|nr:1-acyl-sn-glycerol-3-phosphate acyltransferase [Acidobacteriota bacterium]